MTKDKNKFNALSSTLGQREDISPIERAKKIIENLEITPELITKINEHFAEHQEFSQIMKKAIRPKQETMEQIFDI